MFAVMVRDVVRAMGRPSGMNATAALTQLTIRRGTLIQSGWDLRSHAALNQLAKAQGYTCAVGLPKNDDENYDNGDEERDDEYKSEDLLLQRSHPNFRLASQFRDAAEDGIVSCRNANTQAGTGDAVCTLKTNIVCLEIVLLGKIDGGRDRFGFTFVKR